MACPLCASRGKVAFLANRRGASRRLRECAGLFGCRRRDRGNCRTRYKQQGETPTFQKSQSAIAKFAACAALGASVDKLVADSDRSL